MDVCAQNATPTPGRCAERFWKPDELRGSPETNSKIMVRALRIFCEPSRLIVEFAAYIGRGSALGDVGEWLKPAVC